MLSERDAKRNFLQTFLYGHMGRSPARKPRAKAAPWLALILLWLTLGPLPGEGASSPHPNLVPNPSFEMDSDADGVPDGWRQELLGEPDPSLPSTGQGRTGERAVYIPPRAHAAWTTSIEGVRPGHHYLLTFWVKQEGWRDGEYPFLRFGGQEIRLHELFSWMGWRKVSHVIRADEGGRVPLGFRSPGLSHGFALDDVELREIAFQSLHPPSGEVIQDGRPLLSWTLPPSDLVFRLRVELSRDPDFRDPSIVEMMSPGRLGFHIQHPLGGSTWHWKVRAFLGEEEVARSEVQDFRVAEGRGAPAESLPRLLRLGPLPIPPSFFPIGLFAAEPESFKELKEAGFNAVHSNSRPSDILEAAAANGLKALIPPPLDLGESRAQAFVRKAASSPGLLGWYIEDEPEGRGVSPAGLWVRAGDLRRLSPQHPAGLALLRSSQARYYGPPVDVILVDPYPVPTQPLTWLSDSIDEVRRAIGPEKAVWAIIQAFNWGTEDYYPEGRPGRFPTLAEQRALTYLAIVHAVRGIYFFSESRARKDQKHWTDLKKLAGELHCLLPLLASPSEPSGLREVDPSLDPKGRPAIHHSVKMLAGDSPPAPGCPAIRKGRYLIAVNPWDTPFPLRLRGFEPDEKGAMSLLEDHALPIGDGELRDRLGPLGVRIWRLVREN